MQFAETLGHWMEALFFSMTTRPSTPIQQCLQKNDFNSMDTQKTNGYIHTQMARQKTHLKMEAAAYIYSGQMEQLRKDHYPQVFTARTTKQNWKQSRRH
ncbi:hypothetical protein ElyMa_001371100 [Elysia marginata]|uniref:Uncharacterized protein n=1 Tax=Elysia marginata TaxID=1093978 RepID=A0AAV4IUQ0_9GAST|nr:hypothetical protein ElyMa_001371100 [Elysia marginata]